ncbi:ABC transporter substrate-binding protein [Nesterenkonia salmonea]|uniref:ABC transporter substrate-binding protein n=1 Tax=Nesterenkonia salmonea TaxID=1804987 RepID=A0A5R9BLQ4_9MICC|nr:ABC transporter substrate-binding protein [Nesterenkonia salmonea]TLQ01080.1 ABC transporter substrate-binding protein [Nesterenkonia salmonea]
MGNTQKAAAPRGRRVTALTAAVLLGSATAACGAAETENTPGVTDDTVTIGTHHPLTGPAAGGFASISAATSAYFEYINDNGGIHGRDIEYIVRDDAYSPSNTQSVVRELVQQEDIFALVNGLGTPTHSSVLEYLDQNDVPDLFVSSGSLVWNQPDEFPNTFGYNADYVTEGAALGQYILDSEDDPTICLLGQDDDFGESMLEGVEGAVGDDGVAEVQWYSTANEDVTAQIGAMQSAGCDANILATINGFTALALGTAAQLQYEPNWYASSSGGDYPTLVDHLGDAAPLLEGLISVNYLQNTPESDWYELFEDVNEEYNGGAAFTGNTTYGMSVAYVFAETLARTGEEPTREAIVETLASGEVVGNGIVPLTYAEDDHFGNRTVQIAVVEDEVQDFIDYAYQVTDGEPEAVEPDPVPLENEGIPSH